jgi:hypothetical protein
MAHGVTENDKAFIEGPRRQHHPYVYLGAKHMVTGYDHLLFLAGVIFFPLSAERCGRLCHVVRHRAQHHTVAGCVAGHSANPFLIDAIIGLSVVYKAIDNLDGFRTWFGRAPNPKAAVLIFGFFHGFGLATKLQELTLAKDGMLANLVSFNIGVEMGQFMALTVILLLMNLWRLSDSFRRTAILANATLMTAGFVLIGYH